jgi:multimeric flavodoxin WrbA
MNVLYVSGSPIKKSNTDHLLKEALSVTGGELIKVSDYHVEPCRSCWGCLKTGECAVDDDMRRHLIPMLLEADVIVLGIPVFAWQIYQSDLQKMMAEMMPACMKMMSSRGMNMDMMRIMMKGMMGRE